MSIGMKNKKIFSMILLEALILGIFGTVIGTLSGLIIQLPLIHTGINLSLFAQSLNSLGVGAIIYPIISPENTFVTFITIPIVTVLGAIYPAVKAIRLQPVYALHYV